MDLQTRYSKLMLKSGITCEKLRDHINGIKPLDKNANDKFNQIMHSAHFTIGAINFNKILMVHAQNVTLYLEKKSLESNSSSNKYYMMAINMKKLIDFIKKPSLAGIVSLKSDEKCNLVLQINPSLNLNLESDSNYETILNFMVEN